MIIKRARAQGFDPDVEILSWARKPSNIRTASAKDITSQASEILNDHCNPENYLFSHVTVVCSVDTNAVSGQIGPNVVSEGLLINRKYAEYDITAEHQKYINNNKDAWERELLMLCYPTFIGAHNFCFVPGTKVMMSDRTYKNIEDVEVGDEVISHTGKTKKVVHLFERDIEDEVHSIFVDRYKDPIICTGNHPFRLLDIEASETYRRPTTSIQNNSRYLQSQKVNVLKGKPSFLKNVKINQVWAEAASVKPSSYLLGNCLGNFEGLSSEIDKGYLLGYYLAEGCIADKYTVVFSYGHHESILAEDTLTRISKVFPDARSRVVSSPTSLRVEVNSQDAVAWFLEYGYRLSHTKKLSQSVFSWDQESLLSILVGWITGDGNYNSPTKRLRGVSVSFDLICQMKSIADICGIKTSITKINVPVGTQVGTCHYRLKDGTNKTCPIISRHQSYVLTVSSQDVSKIMSRSIRWQYISGTPYSSKDVDIFKYEDKRVFKVNSNTKSMYVGKVYNFEVEDDNSYVVYPGVAVHNCEHLQVEEQSKGKIIDAVPRDIGDSVYIDILMATSKKHVELIKAIKEHRINAVSMGCSVLETQCTKCGNVAPDEAHMCRHVIMMKGSKFEGPDGKERMVAELCGNKSKEPHGGVRFIEASWVKVPAFKGAVLRNIIDLSDLSGDRLKKVASDLRAMGEPSWNPSDAPRIVNSLVLNGMMRLAARGEEDAFAPVEAVATGGAVNPIEDLEQKMIKLILSNVREKLTDLILPQKPAQAPTNITPMGSNDNIVRVGSQSQQIEQLYNTGLSAISSLCKTNKARLRYTKIYNDHFGIKIPRWIYAACYKLGNISKYSGPLGYLGVCERVLKRRLSMDETDALLKISSILRDDCF